MVDLRLSGVMYRQIVETILGSVNLSKLEAMFIDNLQDPGHSRDKYPFQSGTDMRFKQEDKVDTSDTTWPGTMRGIFPLLCGECTSLRILHYRKAGWVINNKRLSLSQDRQCYDELAAFLRSTVKTLQTFNFEQGMPLRWINKAKAGDYTRGGCLGNEYFKSIRPICNSSRGSATPTEDLLQLQF